MSMLPRSAILYAVAALISVAAGHAHLKCAFTYVNAVEWMPGSEHTPVDLGGFRDGEDSTNRPEDGRRAISFQTIPLT